MAVFAAVAQQAKSLMKIRECCLPAHPLIMAFNLPFTAASTDDPWADYLTISLTSSCMPLNWSATPEFTHDMGADLHCK
ncbi:MAG: hypothetical protein ACI9XK_000792 [Granulosicoccus sp.]|jgi:hypothetical protein